MRRTGRARPRWRPRRWRCLARTARPAACGCEARRWPAGTGRRGPGFGGREWWWWSWSLRDRDLGRVGDDAPVEHLDAAGHPPGDALVVGDDQDRDAAVVQA